jgi:hypothetical protein
MSNDGNRAAARVDVTSVTRAVPRNRFRRGGSGPWACGRVRGPRGGEYQRRFDAVPMTPVCQEGRGPSDGIERPFDEGSAERGSMTRWANPHCVGDARQDRHSVVRSVEAVTAEDTGVLRNLVRPAEDLGHGSRDRRYLSTVDGEVNRRSATTITVREPSRGGGKQAEAF